MTEQQATEQQASREAHLNTNGRKGNSSSVRSDTQGVAGKTAGSRTYAQMDTRGAIQDRASITPYNKFTGRYGTICDGGTCILLWILYGNMVDFSFIVSLYVSDLPNVTIICDGGPTGSNIAPRQLTLKSDSSGTITSVMYALGTTFSAIRRFSIIPIQIGSASPYLSAENRTARFVFTFEFFRQIRGVEIATVRPHLVANRESVTDGRNSHRTAARKTCRNK